MARKVTYALGPIEGVGLNITGAKAHAEKQAVEALNRLAKGGTAFPAPPGSEWLVIEIRPNLYDWGYGWVEKDHFSFRIITTGFDTYEKALWAAIVHGAQLALDRVLRNPATVMNQWFDEIEQWASDVLSDPSQATVLRVQMRERCSWISRYEGWRARGLSDQEAHQCATEGRPS